MTKNVWFWAMVAAGAVAGYLMVRRGVRLDVAATESIAHPVGSLVREAENAAA